MKVSAQYAQEHLPDLLTAASSGEEVEIALPGKPALFLAPRPSKSYPHLGALAPNSSTRGKARSLCPLPTNGARWTKNSKTRCSTAQSSRRNTLETSFGFERSSLSFTDRKRLPSQVLQLIEEDTNDLIVSRASIWEIAIKVAKGTLTIPGSSVRSLLDQIELTGMSILPIENAHILRLEKLPRHHKDPFDRIIVAQAIEENLPILTSDEDIPMYPVNVIWK